MRGIPILLNEKNSVFRKSDYTHPADQPTPQKPWWLRALSQMAWLVPDKSRCFAAMHGPAAIAQIRSECPNARILVIGCGEDSLGVFADPQITYTDVAFGPLTQIVCDAHDLPFPDASFDAVLAVAVLEHVISPWRCVEEIERVLVPNGFVFAAVPFLQAVHMGAYDFTRFTYLGLRALFAGFGEVQSGISNGPAMTLTWSTEYFFASFFTGRLTRAGARAAARLVASPLIYFDKILNTKPGAYDGASAFFFFGRKTDHRLTPREIISLHRGLNPG